VRSLARTLGLVAIAVLVTAGVAVADDKTPDATIEFTGGSVAAGIGFSWGSGTVTYKGKQHEISIDGLSVGDVGATRISLSGKVYNLKKLEDINGNYAGVGAGATVGGGGSAVTMRNQNGVVIEAVSTTQGLKVSLATGGANIKLKD
jgi:hypothetical protein